MRDAITHVSLLFFLGLGMGGERAGGERGGVREEALSPGSGLPVRASLEVIKLSDML